MTADEFRSLALEHSRSVGRRVDMGHADFRVRGKIFATLGPDEIWGMVKLTPDQQAVFVRTDQSFFNLCPAAGAGGSNPRPAGSGDRPGGAAGVAAAWRNTAPKRLAQQLDDG